MQTLGDKGKTDEAVRLITERKEDFRRAEHFLLNYDEELKSYRDAKEDFMRRPADENAGRRGAITHPTESKALRSVRFDEKSAVYKWLKAVEIAVRGLSDGKRFFIKLRRDAARANSKAHSGRRAWVAYVQTHYSEAVGCAIGERTVKMWNSSIIWRIVDIHLRLEKIF